MWMDHRAVSQVDRINATQHRVLSYVGGVMSVEMQPPKLLWIKEVSTLLWSDPNWQPRTSQLLAHCRPQWDGGENRKIHGLR